MARRRKKKSPPQQSRMTPQAESDSVAVAARAQPDRAANVSGPDSFFRRQRLILLVILTAGVAWYLVRFLGGGGLRATLYELFLKKYVLLPDEVFGEIWSRWTWGGGGQIAVFDRTAVFLVAATVLTSAWGAGRVLLPARLRGRLDPLEIHLFALAIGLNVLSLYTLALGLAGLLHQVWLLRAPMLVAIVAGAGGHWSQRAESRGMVPTTEGRSHSRSALLYFAALAAPVLVLYLLTAALPPWEFDVREYHLEAPKEWLLAGRIGFVPHNVYANMPLGAEMHALAAMMWMPKADAWWWGALAGKVVIASYSVLTAAALFTFGRRYFSPRAGAIAALAYLTIPWIFHVSTNGLIEGALAFYLWTSVYGLVLAWPEYRAERQGTSLSDASSLSAADSAAVDHRLPDPRTGRSILATTGFLAGAAVATKYPGLVFVAIPLSLAVVWRVGRVQVGTVFLFGLMIAAGCGLWFAKNAVVAGNPTYPLLYDVFGGRTWDESKEQRWQRAHRPQPDGDGRRYTGAQLRRSLDELLWNSDKLSPLVIPLAAFAVLASRRRRLLLGLLGLLTFDFFVWWLLTHRYDRFFLPMFPILAFFAGAGGDWTIGRPWRWFVYLFAAWATMMNLFVIGMGTLTGDNRILVPLSILRSEPTGLARLHPAHLYLNKNVPPGWAALLVGEAQPFDLEVPVYWSTCWDACWLETWMRDRSREERLQVLSQHRISHVFVHWHEIRRYREPGNYGFTDYVTRQLVYRELVAGQGILRPVSVPDGNGVLNPESGEVFEVVYDQQP